MGLYTVCGCFIVNRNKQSIIKKAFEFKKQYNIQKPIYYQQLFIYLKVHNRSIPQKSIKFKFSFAIKLNAFCYAPFLERKQNNFGKPFHET